MVHRVGIPGNHASCQKDNQEIRSYLLGRNGGLSLFAKHQIIKVKIHTERDHGDCQNPLLYRCVCCTTAVQHGKASCSGSSHGECDRIKCLHAGKQQGSNGKKCHAKINLIQNFSGSAHSRNKFGNSRSRALCLHQVHDGTALHRKQCKNEHKNAHTANPVGKASPEQAGV